VYEIDKVFIDIRSEGMNQGLITTFIRFGTGSSYNTLDEMIGFLKDKLSTKWICICGEDTIRVGTGVLVQQLKAWDFSIEIIYTGNMKEPNWFNSVNLWMVDFRKHSYFEYSRLRPKDSIRFKVPDVLKLTDVIPLTEELVICPAVQVVSIPESNWLGEGGWKFTTYENLGRADRLRVCRRQE
jgi:hypothetical protein